MTRSKAPKIPCPMSGKRGSAWGGYDQCEYCGKMVFIADRDSRYAKHDLPAELASVLSPSGKFFPIDNVAPDRYCDGRHRFGCHSDGQPCADAQVPHKNNHVIDLRHQNT